jgi:hypothetical protein
LDWDAVVSPLAVYCDKEETVVPEVK